MASPRRGGWDMDHRDGPDYDVYQETLTGTDVEGCSRWVVLARGTLPPRSLRGYSFPTAVPEAWLASQVLHYKVESDRPGINEIELTG
eukprot:5071249-Amphidinium_carterae.1